ncbi:MAG: hypothetical protein IJF83_00080 [Methanobrevibacter sp.]|nr:hypothetical protein [Methanobrevibacter sp.]
MTKYVLNSWAWNMAQPKKGTVDYEDLTEDEFDREVVGAISCIGNPILAQILELPYNPSYINLDVGDVALVISLKGGRIPVGTTEFPEDVTVKYTKVEIQEAAVV